MTVVHTAQHGVRISRLITAKSCADIMDLTRRVLKAMLKVVLERMKTF